MANLTVEPYIFDTTAIGNSLKSCDSFQKDVNKQTESNENKHKFIWKLPSIPLSQKEVICSGYVRANYHYKTHFIPELIKLFALFYTNDPYTIDDIKNALHLQRFMSPMFTVQGFKWYLEFYPNGSNDNNKGLSILYLCLAILPPKILSIELKYKLSIIETKSEYIDKFIFNTDEAYDGWSRDILSLKDINKSDIKSLTFCVEMPVIHQHGTNNQLKVLNKDNIPYEIEKKLPISKYQWTVNEEKKVEWIKNIKVGQFLNGKVMTLGPFRMYLQFCQFLYSMLVRVTLFLSVTKFSLFVYNVKMKHFETKKSVNICKIMCYLRI